MRPLLLLGLLLANAAHAATVFTGLDVSFSKDPFADPQLAENQDLLTDNVVLTRDSVQGLFNIAVEGAFVDGSPTGTLWAFAGLNGNPADISAEDFADLSFTDWESSLGGRGELAFNILDRLGVIYLIEDDIYLEVLFTDWGRGGGAGGSFSYFRSDLSAIPLPAGLPLLLSGLFGLGFLGRRSRAQ
ncbi:MAG: hypothetical protein AAGA68_19925 [Pseudomonadota bacterium]